MASDEKLKDCGWCHSKARERKRSYEPYYGYSCSSKSCPLWHFVLSEDEWNRRAPVPGAVRKYVDIDGWNLMNDGTLRHCAMWSERLREDDIPVEVRPVEGE